MSIRCPNCGHEFATEHDSDLHYMQSHVFLNGEPVTRVTSNTLNTQENEMTLTIDTTNTNGVNTMEHTMNTMDMNTLAELVAQRVNANIATTAKAKVKATIEGGKFATTSKFYGKEICGFMYNPFLVPRFLEKQYKDMMNKYKDMSIRDAVRGEVTYMDSIYFMIDECHRLSYMDEIAFAERSKFWSVNDVRVIFLDYFKNLEDDINKAKIDVINSVHKKKRQVSYFKYRNVKYPAHIDITKVTRKNGSVTSKATLVIDWKYDKMIAEAREKLPTLKTYGDIYKYMSLIRKELVILKSQFERRYVGNGVYKVKNTLHGYQFHPSFLEGYLKKGAYYTLANMIRFSHANVYEYKPENNRTPQVLSGRVALEYIRSRLDEGDMAYQFHAMLKRTMNITR